MPKLTFETVKKQLKDSGCRVRLYKFGSKLYLRGTLPPKPNSQKQKPHQQWISLDINDSDEGLKRARAIAFSVSASLDTGTFSWKDYSDIEDEEDTVLVRKAIEQFEKDYFELRGWTKTKEQTYKKHYKRFFNMLPSNQPLTKKLISDILTNKTEVNSDSRREGYIMLASLYRNTYNEEFGEVHLKGKVKDTNDSAVDPNELPSDELIEETYDQIINYNMSVCYALMAIYGLRPSECFWVEPESLQDSKGVIRVLTGKTKGNPFWRYVYPSQLEWWEKWRIWDLTVPVSQGRTNNHKGATISKFFDRHPKIDFAPYALRHAYAARLARKNVDSAVAAKWMGHSQAIHTSIYFKFLDRRHFDEVFDKYIKEN